MLRLDGAGLLHERILTFKREDRLGSHALRLLPCSISGVVMIVEVNYVVKVGRVSSVGQTILLSHRLDSIDHLDWKAGRGRRVWLFHDNPVNRWLILLLFQLLAPTNALKTCVQAIWGENATLKLPWLLTASRKSCGSFFSGEVFDSWRALQCQYDTTRGGPIWVWARGNDSGKSFTLHWCCFVHSRSCYLADWPRDLPDNQQTLKKTKWNVSNAKPNTLD